MWEAGSRKDPGSGLVTRLSGLAEGGLVPCWVGFILDLGIAFAKDPGFPGSTYHDDTGYSAEHRLEDQTP